MRLDENSGVWLSAKTAKDGDIVKFLDTGRWVESKRFTYEDGNPVRQLVFKVMHNNEEKQLTLIKASRTNLMDAWGAETDDWIGKKAIINLALNTQGGKSIVLKPVGGVSLKPKQEAEEGFDGEEEPTPF